MEETPAPDNDNPLQAEESLTLHSLCDAASEGNEDSWEKVRQWFRDHDPKEIWEEAQKLGDYSTTALHQSCRNCPPLDVIETFLKDAPEIVRWSDAFGWLPLHYACANGASEDVLRVLADAYPESKTATDRRGRTPLHFALGSTDIPVTAAAVVLLSSTGAASCPDENGMLPLHYACAYGAPEEALHVLTDNNADSITQTDRNGRTPLHFALGNADRQASPNVVRLLLAQNPDVVNVTDNDRNDLPLHLFATRVNALREEQTSEHKNAMECLQLYLDAKPHPTAYLYDALFSIKPNRKQKFEREYFKKCFQLYLAAKPEVSKHFFDAMKSIPPWLQSEAFICPSPSMVQYLNSKTSEPIPTMVVMLDFIFLVLLIIFFQLSANEAIDCLFGNKAVGSSFHAHLGVLIATGTYFGIREVMQIIKYARSGSLLTLWLSDIKNILDVCLVVVTFLWYDAMRQCTQLAQSFDLSGKEWYQTAMAFTVLLYTSILLLFLKSVLLDFAVFVSGMVNVMRNLFTFLVSLMIVLLAFAGMFTLVFRGTNMCNDTQDDDLSTTENNGMDSRFCTFRDSLATVYFMLLGQIGPDEIDGSTVGKVIYAIFMFIVVILLTNVLIAIVTDSYNHIKSSKAQQVFWYNKFAFISEVDALAEILPKNKYYERFTEWSRKTWSDWIYLKNADDDMFYGYNKIEYLLYGLILLVSYFLVLLWLVVGLVSLGLLWPPQVRKFIFGYNVEEVTSTRVTKHSTNHLRERKTEEINGLKEEIDGLKKETKIDRNGLKKDVDGMKKQMNRLVEDVEEIKKLLRELSKN
mmetsp:Transcript_49567/g.74798  ORF Transcript_49567/g.74798 Transcript_49567/m.74798 type:complete len:806 (-) Transcript_49567:291-2708(-)